MIATQTSPDPVLELRRLNDQVTRLNDHVRRLNGLILGSRSHLREASLAGHLSFVKEMVARHFDLSVRLLISDTRREYICWPRQVGMWLAREVTPASLEVIGRAFGRRHHGTVLCAIERVKACMETEPDIRSQIEALRGRLQAEIKKSQAA